MENKQIKNTEPAVMTDKGPYDTPRDKSADGRYTANKQRGYNLEQQAPETDPEHQIKHHENDDEEEEINKRIYEPLFVKVAEKAFLPLLKEIYKSNPNRVPFLMKTNEWYDKKLGIDFVFGSKNEEGKVNLGYVRTDLKVVDTFGMNNKSYENPNVPINLFKKYPDKDHWEDNTAMNKKHENNYYTFLFPKCNRTKEQIKEYINYDPHISEVKMLHVPKTALDTIVNDKILANKELQQLIEAFKKDDMHTIASHPKAVFQGRESCTIPIKTPDLEINLTFTTRPNGYKEIRAWIPSNKFKLRTFQLEENSRNPFDRR